jgi:hypothetical protein
MSKITATLLSFGFLVLTASNVFGQEAHIHHGFLFFAGEKYTVDEETYGIYDDGNKFEDLIKDNVVALDKFHSYQTWHTTALVTTGLSIAAFVFGGVCYMPGLEKDLGGDIGVIGFAAGGGALVLGLIFEFVAWGSISSAAEIYNGELIDETASKPSLWPRPSLSLASSNTSLTLSWNF